MLDSEDKSTSEPSLDRRRARHAYEFLQGLKEDQLKRITTRAQGLPIAVRSQGLTVVVATLIKEKGNSDLVDHLARWLLNESGLVKRDSSAATGNTLLEHSVKSLRTDYLGLQAEALAYLEHLKRLASALEKSS